MYQRPSIYLRQERIQAIERNVEHAYRTLAQALPCEWYHEGGLTWFFSRYALPLCNGIVHTQMLAGEIDGRIDRIIRRANSRQHPMTWLVSPSTMPSDLIHRLEARGWIYGETVTGMSLELPLLAPEEPPVCGLNGILVQTDAQMVQWLDTFCTGFAFPEDARNMFLDLSLRSSSLVHPSCHLYLGMLNAEPVATALIFFDGKTAGVYGVTTLPKLRRRGIGKWITQYALLQARQQGHMIGVLQATHMGESVYRQLGFRDMCIFHTYIWHPSSL